MIRATVIRSSHREAIAGTISTSIKVRCQQKANGSGVSLLSRQSLLSGMRDVMMFYLILGKSGFGLDGAEKLTRFVG